MCVSDNMGLQNRVRRLGILFFVQYIFIVPRVRFLFKNKKLSIFALILDKFCIQNLITSLKVVRFTSFFFYMILNKNTGVGRRKKDEPVR